MAVGKGVQRVIRKNATPHELRSDGQDGGTTNENGTFVRAKRDIETINIHTQPLTGTEAQNLPSNLRTKTVRRYWTIESSKVDVKKKLVIGDELFSFETTLPFTSHTEGILTRSGKNAHKVI